MKFMSAAAEARDFSHVQFTEDYVRNTLEILTVHDLFELKDGVYTKKQQHI